MLHIHNSTSIFQMKENGQVGRIGHHVLQHVGQAHSFDQEATVVVCHAREILARQQTATVLVIIVESVDNSEF